MSKSKNAAILLRVDIAISAQARLIISKYQEKKAKKIGLTKYLIAGVMLSDIDLSQVDSKWNMLECDIVIVPKMLHSKHNGNTDGYRLDQMLTSDYQEPENWEKHNTIKL